MNDLKEKFPHHFTWASDPDRYQLQTYEQLSSQSHKQALSDQTDQPPTSDPLSKFAGVVRGVL